MGKIVLSMMAVMAAKAEDAVYEMICNIFDADRTLTERVHLSPLCGLPISYQEKPQGSARQRNPIHTQVFSETKFNNSSFVKIKALEQLKNICLLAEEAVQEFI